MTEFRKVQLDQIKPSPFQMRGAMEKGALEQLADSLERDGQQRPVKLRPVERGYEIVFGHRTIEAAKRRGWTEIDAVVERLTDEQVMWAQYAENEFRENISDYDRAKWLRTMIERFSYSQLALAQKVKLSPGRISQLLLILKLEGKFSMLNLLSKITYREATEILKAPEELRDALCEEIESNYNATGELPSARAISEHVNLYLIPLKQEESRPLAEEEGLEEEEVNELELEDSEREQLEEAEERRVPMGTPEPSIAKSKAPSISQEERAPAPIPASDEKAKQYLTALFATYPKLMVWDNEYLASVAARNLGLSLEDAQKRIKAFREEKRRAQSSGAPKTEEEKPKIETRRYEAEGKWQKFQARPTPEISTMEQAIQHELYARGFFFETQKEIPIRTVIPDLWFDSDPPLAVFLDGPVHQGREDRDEELRDLLRRRGVKVLSIAYTTPSQKAVEEAVKQVMGEVST